VKLAREALTVWYGGAQNQKLSCLVVSKIKLSCSLLWHDILSWHEN
jgi:hypothetical protein